MEDKRICAQTLGSASSTANVRESGSADGDDEDTPSRKRSLRHLSNSNSEESRWIRSYLDSKSAADERRSILKKFRLEIGQAEARVPRCAGGKAGGDGREEALIGRKEIGL